MTSSRLALYGPHAPHLAQMSTRVRRYTADLPLCVCVCVRACVRACVRRSGSPVPLWDMNNTYIYVYSLCQLLLYSRTLFLVEECVEPKWVGYPRCHNHRKRRFNAADRSNKRFLLVPKIYRFGVRRHTVRPDFYGWLSRYSDRLGAGRPEFDSWQGARCSFLLRSPPSLLWVGTEDSFSSAKTVGTWSWPLAFIYRRGQEWRSCTLYVFMVWCIIIWAQGQHYIFYIRFSISEIKIG
jgi:hypothetical protein